MGKEDRAVVALLRSIPFTVDWAALWLEVLGEDYPVPVIRVGPDRFGESGSPDELLTAFQLNTDSVVNAIKKAAERKSRMAC